MYSIDRPPPSRGQALPSLKSIFSSDSPPDFQSQYTARTHHSPPLPPFQPRGSPRESTIPSIHASSRFYPSYQTPPPQAPQTRDGSEMQRYPSMPSSSQALPHPPPSRESLYSLSSGPSPPRPAVESMRTLPLRQYEQEQSHLNSANNTARILVAPTQHGTPERYSGSPQSIGPVARTARVVDERYIAGEGLCYVYEDGTRVQKYIDGEGVNPQWGVTKAGKPRKRLAQACTTCREKKIKCDPSSPKCIQCQKFGRECRFENA